MKYLIILLAAILFSCSGSGTREMQFMKYSCLPNYALKQYYIKEDAAAYKFSVDTNLLASDKFKIEFVWNTGDTGILQVTKPGTYYVSIKGYTKGKNHAGGLVPNSDHTALIPQSPNSYKWEWYCYIGKSDGFWPDTIYENDTIGTGYHYKIIMEPAYNGFYSGLIDSVVINHVVKPIVIGPRFLSNNGKIVTLNQWYTDKTIKGW